MNLKKRVFVFYTIISIIFFGILIKLEYATDTYSVFNFNVEQIYMQYAMLGRFITAIVGKIIKVINASEYGIYMGSWILAIICTIICQYKLYTIIKKDVKNKAIRLIIPTLIIINPFSIELFLYIEKGIMWFGILMCILALSNLINFFENQQKGKYLIYAILFIFLANCCYQGVIGLFVGIATVYILKYSKTFSRFIINNLIVGLIYGIPTVANYLIVKILFKESRVNGDIVIVESLQKIYKNTIDMFKYMHNLLPKYALIFLILFTFSVFCSKIFKEKGRFLKLLEFLYILAGVTFAAIVPQAVQPTSSIWMVPRTTYCFASLYGILILYLAMNFELKNFEKTTILIISCILIILQLQKFIQIEQGRFLLNEKDEQITSQIIQQIEQYEAQTGNIITEISVYQDNKPSYTYSGIVAIGDINVKCYVNGWSAVSILNYYLKRDIKLVENDEIEEQQFSKQNWDEFNKEQIEFKQNKLIICNY